MSAQARYARRRVPKQKRSQLVFDRIVATARRLFEEEGYAYVSTNRIAEAAGVSIGSLYQYFPNRESVALAVYEQASARAAQTMKRRALESLGRPLRAWIRANVASLFEVFERDRYPLLQLLPEIPQARRASQPLSFESLVHQATRALLSHHFAAARPAAVARKAYVIEKVVVGVVGRYFEEQPQFLSRRQAIAEVAELIHAYLHSLSRDG